MRHGGTTLTLDEPDQPLLNIGLTTRVGDNLVGALRFFSPDFWVKYLQESVWVWAVSGQYSFHSDRTHAVAIFHEYGDIYEQPSDRTAKFVRYDARGT